jgi:hypothetical protein
MRKSSSTERVPSGLHSPAVESGSLGPLEVFFHRREGLHSTILAPLVALVLWSFVMWAWLYATRIPAVTKGKII